MRYCMSVRSGPFIPIRVCGVSDTRRIRNACSNRYGLCIVLWSRNIFRLLHATHLNILTRAGSDIWLFLVSTPGLGNYSFFVSGVNYSHRIFNKCGPLRANIYCVWRRFMRFLRGPRWPATASSRARSDEFVNQTTGSTLLILIFQMEPSRVWSGGNPDKPFIRLPGQSRRLLWSPPGK
mgnify:FL=1